MFNRYHCKICGKFTRWRLYHIREHPEVPKFGFKREWDRLNQYFERMKY
jgi:hypothetical protein